MTLIDNRKAYLILAVILAGMAFLILALYEINETMKAAIKDEELKGEQAKNYRRGEEARREAEIAKQKRLEEERRRREEEAESLEREREERTLKFRFKLSANQYKQISVALIHKGDEVYISVKRVGEKANGKVYLGWEDWLRNGAFSYLDDSSGRWKIAGVCPINDKEKFVVSQEVVGPNRFLLTVDNPDGVIMRFTTELIELYHEFRQGGEEAEAYFEELRGGSYYLLDIVIIGNNESGKKPVRIF